MMIYSEERLWNELYQRWQRAEMFQGNMRQAKPAIFVGGTCDNPEAAPAFGLCQSLRRLRDSKEVAEDVFQLAENRLSKWLHANGWTNAYHFRLDWDGAKQRAALCSQFVIDARKDR